MPETIDTYDTKFLIEQYGNYANPFTAEEIVNELKERVVSDTDEDEAMRGGIHPTRPSGS